MKRKNDKLELILLGVGILLLLLLFVVKRRLDAPEETATAESRTETMEGKKQEETIQNMEQENAAFLNSKKEEQKEKNTAIDLIKNNPSDGLRKAGIRTETGVPAWKRKPFHERRRIHSFPAGDDLCDGTGMRGSCACGAGR